MRAMVLRTAVAVALAAPVAAPVAAEEVKIGVLLGYTGPIESLTPDMANAAEMAIAEINESGKFLSGVTLVPVRADSTCTDSAAATAAAERLVTAEGVVAIMGADCSGVTTAVANNVGIPNGVPVISPSATSPALSDIEDNGLFFRTAPSDARQGQVLSDVLSDRGVKSVALTYTNNDYGKGFADAFGAAFEAAGGEITIRAAHEDGKADYAAEVGALAAAGGELLVVLGYADQGGLGVIRAALDTGAFDTFAMGDGMISESLPNALGDDLNGSFGTLPWSSGAGSDAFLAAAEAAGFDGEGPYRRESYDAAALIALAMAKGGKAERATIAENLLAVANGPGEEILPGELAKGLEILAAGGEIDYVGATNVELIGPGEASGTYSEHVVEDGAFKSIKLR